MAYMSFIRRSFGFKDNANSIYDSYKFKRRIAAQRNLSSRGGYEFSLLVFSIPKGFVWKPDVVSKIVTRVRSIDEIGWVDNRRIGLLLPYTSADGATKVASLVSHAIKDNVQVHKYFIYNHPSRIYIDTNGAHHKMDLEGLFSLEFPDQSSKGQGARDEHTRRNTRIREAASADPARKELIMSEEDFDLLSGIAPPTWKRGMDIAGAAICLVLFLPIMMITAFAVKVSSKGPIFFKQDRVGFGMRPFKMYKFRSMVVTDSLKNTVPLTKDGKAGPFVLNKIESDPRITRVGRFIRKWSLDELPQLFNVLIGDMSLVGPRPLIREEAKACKDWHESRFVVKPGLTCIWQVNGRSGVKAEERSRMDLRYILNLSLSQDLKLLLLTPVAVIKARGAM